MCVCVCACVVVVQHLRFPSVLHTRPILAACGRDGYTYKVRDAVQCNGDPLILLFSLVILYGGAGAWVSKETLSHAVSHWYHITTKVEYTDA